MHKGWVKDLRNWHGSAMDGHGQVCGRKNCTKDWSYDWFLISKPFPFQSVADPAMFSRIFIIRSIKDERDVTRISRMSLGTIRTPTDELWMRYGRATDTNIRTDFPENQTRFFCNALGILSDPWHVTTDPSMPLRISQGHYGWPYGRKRWSVNHLTFSILGNILGKLTFQYQSMTDWKIPQEHEKWVFKIHILPMCKHLLYDHNGECRRKEHSRV